MGIHAMTALCQWCDRHIIVYLYAVMSKPNIIIRHNSMNPLIYPPAENKDKILRCRFTQNVINKMGGLYSSIVSLYGSDGITSFGN